MSKARHWHPSRREWLAGASATALAGSLGNIPMAAAKAPMSNVQAPAFYRFRVGASEATVISDGPLSLGDPSKAILGASAEELGKLLADNFLPKDNLALEQNALVINTGERVVLFDTGTGGPSVFGPSTGRLLVNFKSAGIEARDVEAVVLTHAHPDHCWGLVSADGGRTFPNAQISMSQADFDFWTDEAKASLGDMMKMMIDGTRRNLLPNRDRIVFIKNGQEFLPGIQALSAPGHTVGHMIFMITSEDSKLCNVGDIAHHHIAMVEKPQLEFAFDTDAKQAVKSRVRTLDTLAANRIPLVAYHFPWPGIGHVAKHGDGFRYVPAPMQMVL
jgi:glyoxylase-like metal-dependent hydrolase (beta-lactamase superfamily II)